VLTAAALLGAAVIGYLSHAACGGSSAVVAGSLGPHTPRPLAGDRPPAGLSPSPSCASCKDSSPCDVCPPCEDAEPCPLPPPPTTRVVEVVKEVERVAPPHWVHTVPRHPDADLSAAELAAKHRITASTEWGPPPPPPSADPARPIVVAIMAIWDEALTLPMSLESTKHFVTEYIVVHKLGTDNTSEVLRACAVKWGLRVRYFVSNMTLRAARQFSVDITRHYAQIYVIQDGDEVFYSGGPTAIQNSLDFFRHGPYECIESKMVYLKHDLRKSRKDGYRAGGPGRWHGFPNNGIVLIPHTTIFINRVDGFIMPADLALDVFACRSSALILNFPWKFDVSIKNPLRELLREYFVGWSAAGSPGTIEEWAERTPGYHSDAMKAGASHSLQQSAEQYVAGIIRDNLAEYNDEEWFPYPEAIRRYIDAGRYRGHEGPEVL